MVSGLRLARGVALSIPLHLIRPAPTTRARRVATTREAARARAIARWMDTLELDPLLGLILPGLGDLAGAVIGLYVVRLAWRQRLPASVIARMIFNLALDAALGAIPLAGDLFDLAFRAHHRNAELLLERVEAHPPSWRDHLALAGAVILLLLALALPVLVFVRLAPSFAG